MKWIFLLSFFFIQSLDARALCTTGDRVNLRPTPNAKKTTPVSWKVYRDMPLQMLGKKGNWIHVSDVDGEKHWVLSSLTTDRYRCAVIRVKKAKLRKGPGKKYALIDGEPIAVKYTSFRYLKQKGTWTKLRDEYGQEMWVFRKLIWVQ